ncbi:MAG: RNA methyltransferase PUA domain-containing protein, partial [Pseudomonadota bacterium]|nr:RNA methyltransferase PUA domain-containing protein [Pseudomonadota bacterium]
MALRFYVAGDHQIDQRLLLDSERSNYLCRVLRHRVGDVIEVFNGIGTVSSCKITSDDARKSELLVLSLTSSTRQHGLTLGIGI